MKKLIIFGNTINTKLILDYFLTKYKIDYLITIDPSKAKKNNIFNYFNYKNYCKNKNIKLYFVKNFNLLNDKDYNFFKKIKPDIGFVNGWQRLIPPKILDTFKIGVFGMHGSSQKLPKGRGRSPLNWSIIEGRRNFYTNLFKYNSAVDAGDILATYKFKINLFDTSETLHFKNTISMKYLIDKNFNKIINKKFTLKKQKKTQPSFYPKRKPENSEINWRDNVENIYRFVNSVTKPFNGAFGFIRKKKIIIWKSSIFFNDINNYNYNKFKIGQILEIFNKKILVRCSDGVLLVDKYEYDSKITIKDKLEIRKVKKFKKNKNGFYDI